MRRLGLDTKRGSNRSALELLDAAHTALEQPSCNDGDAVSILITLRESINSMFAGLIARRPTQESAKKDREKVISIGSQCGRNGLAPAHFERLGDDASALLNHLSGSKQADVPRERLIEDFQQGLLFLNAFMSSIDETKLKVI
jgi:hypothetical protein